MPRGKENEPPGRKGVRGTYRKWDRTDMKKALDDCNGGMAVRQASRLYNVPRGE